MNRQSKNSTGRVNGENPYVYVIFGAIGVVLVLGSIILNLLHMESFAPLALNVGASVLVVVIVELIWRSRGGDPITRAIASLWQATGQLQELKVAGITSVKRPRRDLGVSENVKSWQDYLETATRVDLMAFTLRAQISKYPELMQAIKQAISSNLCQVRVLTLHPFTEASNSGPVILQRINEEKLLAGGGGALDRVKGALEETWSQFGKLQQEFSSDPQRKDCLQLRSTHHVTMYVNIIRIDERMWVSPYLASVTGGSSPTFEITGPRTELFSLFEQEFEHMWTHASPPRSDVDGHPSNG